MSKKKGLGKGLGALLDSDTLSQLQLQSDGAGHMSVSISRLSPNPFQPRKVFDEKAITTLADSIKQHGIIQPLAVREIDTAKDGEANYEIIAGERRFRAAQLAGLEKVPVVVHAVSDADSAAFALIENLQREDLNVIEKAKGIRRLIEDFDLTHEACGLVLGQSRSSVSNTLRLLELGDVVQEALADKSIDMGHARALLALEQSEQHEVLQTIRLNGLSVRETEALVKEQQGERATVPKRKSKTPYLKQTETQLSEHLQTKVNISQQAGGNGKITLAFSDDKMLKQLLSRLGLLEK